MKIQVSDSIEINAPRETVVARAFDPRVTSIETNGFPGNVVGQVATVTADGAGKHTVVTTTTVDVRLPEYMVERNEGSGPAHVTRSAPT